VKSLCENCNFLATVAIYKANSVIERDCGTIFEGYNTKYFCKLLSLPEKVPETWDSVFPPVIECSEFVSKYKTGKRVLKKDSHR
jgi:hypothetical protein